MEAEAGEERQGCARAAPGVVMRHDIQPWQQASTDKATQSVDKRSWFLPPHSHYRRPPLCPPPSRPSPPSLSQDADYFFIPVKQRKVCARMQGWEGRPGTGRGGGAGWVGLAGGRESPSRSGRGMLADACACPLARTQGELDNTRTLAAMKWARAGGMCRFSIVYVFQCCAVLCSAVLCCAVLCCAVLCAGLPHCVFLVTQLICDGLRHVCRPIVDTIW